MAEVNVLSLKNDANLKAYYRMETGALTTDSGVNGYTLTNNNTVGEIAGKFGIAADFGTSNTNKSLTIANSLGITGSSDFGFSFWVKLRAEIGSGTWTFLRLNSGTAGGDTYRVFAYQYNAGTRRIAIDVGSASFTYNLTMGTANWYHFVLNKSSTTITLYVNTVSAGTGSFSAITPGTTGLSLGNDGSTYASIAMDDVALFNRALTVQEISDLYNEVSVGNSSSMFLSF